ncbi:MAG: alanine racemase, partial [Pseudomonadales bacterium]|nr:alanine racemase [Pseudomonadales bacterium]
MPNAPVAMIDTGAVSENLNLVRQKAPRSKVMAVVKANAYGHGYDLLERGLESADGFGVARVEEAVALRQMGVNKPITVLEGFLDTEELSAILHYDLSTVFHSMYQFEKIDSLIDYPPVKAWIKVDTGMNRLGLNPDEFRNVMKHPGEKIDIAGIIFHFAKSAVPVDDIHLCQFSVF